MYGYMFLNLHFNALLILFNQLEHTDTYHLNEG